jgi:hypothetical protein
MELILSVFMLSIVVVFIASTFLSLLGAATKGEDITVSRQIIERRLSELSNDEDQLRAIAARAMEKGIYDDDPVLCRFSDSMNETTYSVSIKVRDLISALDKSLYFVDVEVSWWDPQRKIRQGYGRLSNYGSRALYVRR